MAGNNAFFVRDDLLISNTIEVKTPKDIFKYSSFRQSRDENGSLTYLSHEEALSLLSECKLQNIETLEMIKIKDIQ